VLRLSNALLDGGFELAQQAFMTYLTSASTAEVCWLLLPVEASLPFLRLIARCLLVCRTRALPAAVVAVAAAAGRARFRSPSSPRCSV
jgi:hypothetical protein